MKKNRINKNTWKIFKNVQDLEHIQNLLSEYQIWEPTDQNIILRFGYKILSSADKETYYLLRDLGLMNEKRTGHCYAEVGQDYLAISLGTTTECQRQRLKKLEKVELISIVRRYYGINRYIINTNPYPDTTFLTTIENLILRKRINQCISLLKGNNNPSQRIDLIKELLKLVEKGGDHYKLKNILPFITIGEETQEIRNLLSQHNVFNQ